MKLCLRFKISSMVQQRTGDFCVAVPLPGGAVRVLVETGKTSPQDISYSSLMEW